ncbi:methyl-accepting chemotaxis protein [Aliiglaciecola sp. 3_MG-2023]|uniref:methyl-accepting chemotaxis protein n=1 Tax=Aliiglaciecola sp. 3_MG-2023 TaxID=3062644 RepID=UPI0026E329B1|nr:methyl-accepting chemotaxis protein [Aliiglaciecola sp. 3_MG-2023]MDO6694886.1 methyl-accepting chemotaxis protein [Aliiglaciecola sp. 3_MG-2023]
MTRLIINFLRHFNVVKITLISLIVFSILVVFFASVSLHSAWQQVQQSDEDLYLLNILDKLEKVAHHHAVERGLTAGFLASGSDTQYAALKQQRLKADIAADDLRNTLNRQWPEKQQLNAALLLYTKHIQQQATIRKQVDAGSAARAFRYYSLLNRFALDAVQNLRGKINNQDVYQGVSGALYLAWLKEYAGQSRGKINGAIAKKQVSNLAKSEIEGYVTNFQITSQYLPLFLSLPLQQQIDRIFSSPSYREMLQIQSEILQSKTTNIETEYTSEQWFKLATQQIVALKKVLDQQWMLQHQLSQDMRSQAMFLLVLESVILAIVMILLAILNIYLVRSMRLRLKKLTIDLQKIADNGDLTVDIRLKGKDELGAISNSMHVTFAAFRNLIINLISSIQSGQKLGEELNSASKLVLRNGEHNHLLASNIATSLEEMSQTSEEIAKSATITLEASDKLQEKNSQNIEVNLSNSNALKTMSHNMLAVRQKANNMEQQVTAISSILETINSLADQTNLLALNAAIEAARAGEAGRGFAVVADEVRKLAKGSKSSSDSISQLLKDLQGASNDVVLSIEENVSTAQDSLQRAADVEVLSAELIEQVSELEQLSITVATAAEEQAVTIKQIAEDTTEVLDSSNEGLSIAKDLESIFGRLSANEKAQQQMIESFIVEGAESKNPT